jgi:cytochrome c-type biogenesis protein
MNDLFNAFPYIGALVAGLLSFLSPCVLPLMPSYLSFITGISFENLQNAADNRQRIQLLTLANSLFFILGFSLVFISLGASSSIIGRIFANFQDWLRIIGGVVIIFFGLFVSGVLKANFLQREKRLHLRGKPAGYMGSTIVGTAFAAGWTPCIGPILGTILLYASAQGSTLYGVKLLSMYSLGLAIPFLFASLAFNSFLSYSKRIRKHMRVIMVANGILLMVFGILLLTNKLTMLASLFPSFTVTF